MAAVYSGVYDKVTEYYTKDVTCTADCQCQVDTTASVCRQKMSPEVTRAIKEVHEDVQDKWYCCGLISPQLLHGMTVLDLGCGTGRDVYALSYLVGEEGHVIGIDMSDEQMSFAEKYKSHHQEKFGFKKSNVEFKVGHIEKLREYGIKESSVDVIVSNCVICLCPDKRAVMEEVFQVLKAGGEFYFSDMYADARIPESIKEDKVLFGEGFGGAFYWKDFVKQAQGVGFTVPRIAEISPLYLTNSNIASELEGINYLSVTYRLFKPGSSSSAAAAVCYNGSVPEQEEELWLDLDHGFKKGEPVTVNAEMVDIIQSSRFSSCFNIDSSSTADSEGLPFEQDADPFKIVPQKMEIKLEIK